MSTFPTKNLIFLHDSKSNIKFLVDSGGSFSILPHSSSAPSTGPHLVGANNQPVPVWGCRRQTVCFGHHNFEFYFFLAAVATPIIGMDFLAKFELSIIPAKQQVLHAAFSKSKEQHWTHLRTLFAILAANGLALNLEKCVFALSGMDFLGHRISAAGVAPLRNNFQVILDSPYPTDCKAMQRFLGMINFYRRFLPGVAGTLRPLTAALSGNPKTLPWTPDMETAFAAAKAALVTAVPLVHPLPGAVLALATDASDTHVGAVLQQQVGQHWQPL
jgi:hypothetical protein